MENQEILNVEILEPNQVFTTEGDVSERGITKDEMVLFCEQYDMNPAQVQTVLKAYGKGMNVYDFSLFLSKARSYELSIERGELRGFKNNKGQIIMFAGRDGFLSLAHRNPAYDSLSSSEVRENDIFELDIANNKIVHKFGTGDRGQIIGAYAVARAKERHPVIEWVDIKTYDKGNNTWASHKAEMIKKVAEVHALKKQFGISGLYAMEEAESMGIAFGTGSAEDSVAETNSFVEEMKVSIKNATTVEELSSFSVEINNQKKKKIMSKAQLTDLLTLYTKRRQELLENIEAPKE